MQWTCDKQFPLLHNLQLSKSVHNEIKHISKHFHALAAKRQENEASEAARG